jgi:uncharacterized membrane protein
MEQHKSSYNVVLVVYILQAIALFTAFPMIIAVIINYIKQDDARGTWLESHFRWQIRTFWFGLLWWVIGAVLCLIFVGYFVLLAAWIWQIYRVIKGWMRLVDHKAMYVTTGAKND